MTEYDEFGLFEETMAEWDLELPVPRVRRAFVAVEGLRQLSALVWGEGSPELVLLHGGAQNAHTYDTLALILQRALIALDLPHHGHSDASPHGRFAVSEHARDVATTVTELTSPPLPLVGMSYGGLVGIALTRANPEVVSHLILVDITPGEREGRGAMIREFIAGPDYFANFEQIMARTKEYNPGRSESSLRRGILHNALERPDGTWVWRHQRHAPVHETSITAFPTWKTLEEITRPVTLIRAMGSSSVVGDEDAAEFRLRRPHDEIIEVPGASHSIQGSHPVELAAIIEGVLADSRH